MRNGIGLRWIKVSAKNKVRTWGASYLFLHSWVWLTFNATGLWPLRSDRQQSREAVTHPGYIFSSLYRTIFSLRPTWGRDEIADSISYCCWIEGANKKSTFHLNGFLREFPQPTQEIGCFILFFFCLFAQVLFWFVNNDEQQHGMSRMRAHLLHPPWSKISYLS